MMVESSEFSRNGMYIIRWNCFSWDYSKENEKKIIDSFSRKYNIPKNRIKVEANTIVVDENGKEISIKSEIIDNIHDKKFQQKLFQDYININNIENVNIEKIIQFDEEVNEKVDYEQYDKLSKINVRWIEFKNFLSFGNELERFDFTPLNGIVLVNSIPANQAGKTTITSELLHFLLYGKTSKSRTMENVFNRFLNNEIELIVRGCVSINGDDYIIERILTRPKKRTKSSKVSSSLKYYKVIDKTWNPDEPLIEYDPETFNNQSEDVNKTNKNIKESLMRESDFELVSCADSKSLDNLIDTSESEKSKIFSRFLGINVIEDKESIAKMIWKDKSSKLLSNQYSSDKLNEDIVEYKRKIETSISNITLTNEKLTKCNSIIFDYNNERDTILKTIGNVDEKISKLDVHTQETLRDNLKQQGTNLRVEQKTYTEKINELKDIVVDKNLVQHNRNAILELTSEIATIKGEINHLKSSNLELETSKVCPTCKRSYDDKTIININNNIIKNNQRIEFLINEGITKNKKKEEIEAQNVTLEEFLRKIDERNKYELKLSQINVNIERTLNQYSQVDQLIKTYEQNRETIARNNQINIAITNINVKISNETALRDSLLKEVTQEEQNIKQYNNNIKANEEIIEKLYIENEYIRHYKLYLTLLSKDGIKKIVLRNVLPIINSSINNLLGDLVNFGVEVQITDKNDINFLINKENDNGDFESGLLISASGFERTMASLALRSVLSKYSSIPSLNFVLFDEITARVSEQNFPALYEMFKRIEVNYQFVFVISHSESFNGHFENKVITIENINNISRILKK